MGIIKFVIGMILFIAISLVLAFMLTDDRSDGGAG